MGLRQFGHVRRRNENSMYTQESNGVGGGRQKANIYTVGKPKKTWSKVVEKDMRNLNITEDVERIDMYQWRPLISQLTLGVLNEDNDDEYK